MRLFAAGTDAVGVIAVGQQATGVIAVGQLATGVVAVGQLARGVVVVGQLGVGAVTFGQLVLGPVWAAGMVGIGGTAGPVVVLPLFGRLRLLQLLRGRPGAYERPRHRTSGRTLAALLVLLGLVALWWFAAGAPLLHELTRAGGILRDAPPPPPARCTGLC